MKKVRITEQELHNLIAESVQGVLNEIGDTPAGQWMLGRLAGRQQNRENGIERKSPVSHSAGRIATTTTAVEEPNEWNRAFYRGKDIENLDWWDDGPDGEFNKENNDKYYDDRTYGEAMQDIINHYSKARRINEAQLLKTISESIKSVLSELDWKTAMNASNKVRGKNKWATKRSLDFRDYADNSGNEKLFGNSDGIDIPSSQITWVGFRNGYPLAEFSNGDEIVPKECPFAKSFVQEVNIDNDSCVLEKSIRGGEASIYIPISDNEVKKCFRNNIEQFNLFMNAVREYNDYKAFRYRYDGEKGWQLKESKNNQYICQNKVRISENELRGIVKSVIMEAVDESGIGLIGARNGAMANLKKRIGLGVRKRIRPDGSVEDQQQRFNDREKSMIEDINKQFVEEFGTEGVDLPCSAWYFGNPVYSFHFKVKRIEQINAHNFSFVGDLSVDNIDAVPETLRPVVIPRNPNNVILVYTFAKREMKFTRKKTGLTMTPHNDGSNGWNKLLKFVGTYNEGYSIVAR